MTGNLLDVFEKSEYADSIYYADLFRIDNKIWMIMGHGKSDAARLASNRIEEDDLARDSVAIKVKNNILFAKCDFGAVRKDKVIFDFEIDHEMLSGIKIVYRGKYFDFSVWIIN